MICHTVRNGGPMFLILFLWILNVASSASEKVYTIQDFCSGNLLIQYIEPGSPFQFTLRTEAASAGSKKWFQKSKRECRRELRTSDSSSHFVVMISNMTIPNNSCANCQCNFFEISVAKVGLTKRYCGKIETEYFTSKSDEISIFFQPRMNAQFDVTLTFSLRRNLFVVSGLPSENFNGGSYIETPYFPIPYSRNYRADYVLQSEAKGHVVLLFLDFQVSHKSFIEVVGSNGTHPTRFYGNTFRPPVIVSEDHVLDIKFESTSEFDMPGFRALCSFIRTIDSLSVPHTDCGGLEEGNVGYMNIKTHDIFSLYDCIWHIKTISPFHSDYLYRSVSIHMKDVGLKSFLEIRDGHFSKSKFVKVIDCETENCTDLVVETTVFASLNLYIRFSGYLDKFSAVNMYYSTYHTGNCSENEFDCGDERCLPLDLRCDDIKQCPNGTDEEQCPITTVPEVKVPVHPNVKKEALFDDSMHKKSVILLIIGSLSMLFMFGAVLFLIYRYFKAIPANIEQAQSQGIGEMSGVPPVLYPNRMFHNDSLDSPPSYEDFIKSSDCYPPLLFTRANQRPPPKQFCAECTTSFSTGIRPRHHSANSFNFRGSDADSDLFVHNSGQGLEQMSSNCCTVEIFSNTGTRTTGNIRKWYSLDSKLNDLAKQDTCHLFLSIIHPTCNHVSNHSTHVHCSTLPPNFKVCSAQSRGSSVKLNATAWLPAESSPCAKDRSCSWSFVPHGPNGSEILTVVKSRCCSDPCKGIRVHYSLN